MPNRMYPSATMPTVTRGMLAPSSAFHIPAAAGIRNAATTTASQNRKTLIPALREASPTAFCLPARYPMTALPIIPTTHSIPHIGPIIHGLFSTTSGASVKMPYCERNPKETIAPHSSSIVDVPASTSSSEPCPPSRGWPPSSPPASTSPFHRPISAWRVSLAPAGSIAQPLSLQHKLIYTPLVCIAN